MTVLVATDGTLAASNAVTWAATEARRRRTGLRIVYAYDSDWLESRCDLAAEYLDVARSLAEAVVADARERARAAVPDLPVETGTLPGNTIPRLLAAAADAELLVLGSRGRGGFTGMLLGSVSQRMAMHAPCPVAVVRDGVGGEDADGYDGAVVAGVDDSPAAEPVLATAFAAAAERDTTLIVVRSHLADDPDAADRLETRLAPFRERFQQVRVETVLTNDQAAAALADAGRHAALTVVGSHGHGTLAAALLGSTVLRLLHEADCPVLVVH